MMNSTISWGDGRNYRGVSVGDVHLIKRISKQRRA